MLVFNKTMRSSAVVALLVAGLAACSEGLTAPQSPMFDASEALMAKGGGGGKGAGGSASRGKDSGSRTFTIWPGFPVFEKFGDHTLYMPPNVVCDPATSGYGAAYWDAPCARADRPIEVTAKWSTHNGRPVISFSPYLRFVPSSSQSRWVQLSLRDTRGIDPDKYYTILWYDKEAHRWVDESQTDPTLKATTSQSGNLVTRRLKHFSEYVLWSGFGAYNVISGIGEDGFDLGGW
jgi:hypothetical protein